MRFSVIIITIAMMLSTVACSAKKKEEESMSIQDGRKVAIHYTLTVDGETIDTSRQRGPLSYTQGEGRIIPGLSKELKGLKAGDKKSVTVAPDEAYGKVNPKAFQEIPKSKLPAEITPKPGMNLQMSSPDGRKQVVRISEVKEGSIVIDTNHPLAGKTLNFDVEVVSVE